MVLLAKAEKAIGKSDIEKMNYQFKQQDEEKMLFIAGSCGIVILLSAFILTYLGLIDLRYVSQITFNSLAEVIGNFIMFMVNGFFVFSISLLIFDRNILKVLIPFAFLDIVLPFFVNPNTMLYSTAFPFIFIILYSIVQKQETKETLFVAIRFISMFALTALYQQLSGYIKLYSMNFTYYYCNILTMFIYSIDLFLFYILIYKVVKKHGRQILFRELWLSCKNCFNVLKQTEPISKDLPDMNKHQWRVFCILVYLYQILQVACILGINVAINKLFVIIGVNGALFIGFSELFIAFVIFEFARRIFGKTLHAKTDFKCNVISFLTYFALSRFLLPLNITLFFNIIIAAGLAYAIHRFATQNEEFQELKRHKIECEMMAHKTRRQKIQLILLEFPPEHVDYDLLKMFANGVTVEKTAEHFHMSIATCNRRIDRAIK